jgi:origin recognition complex subunit 6
MRAIRSLVKQFDLTSAAPHIFTGVESILPLLARMSAAAAETPSKRPQRTTAASNTPAAVTDTRTMALVVVIFLYVFTKMKDVDVTPNVYEEWRKTAVNTLLELTVAKHVTHDDLSLDIQDLMPMAQAEGWLQMEWFLNVEPMEDVGAMEGVEHTGNISRSGAAKSIVAKSGGSDYIGLGTMMQDATDYLGERQRQDFETWKAHIMARVQEVEAA